MSSVQQQDQDTDKTPEKVILGRITGVYGVKGWVKVFSYTDPKEAIVDYSPWFIRAESRNPDRRNGAPWTRVRLTAGKRHAKTVVVKLENCNDRDAAMSYVGTEIAIEKQQLEALTEQNEYYWRDLIGLRVTNQQGIELGAVKSLMETGANDVLVVVSEVEPEAGGETETVERLIPWTMNNAIISVDLEQKIIEVDWDPDF
ncbi:MAG: ribosome maturation factor RimM [Gammaproteobacteria bacterium]|nr:ribosome maturation factor RimM [Gammaproteobacteria bacterium]